MDIKNEIPKNELIAIFMGAEKGESTDAYPNVYTGVPVNGLNTITVDVSRMKYKTSWDWIMPVISKIKTEILKHPKRIDDALITGKIENIYNATVEFIKWHNNRDLDGE